MTAAGAFADEVALFPRSFVDQMIGRCSIEGSKIFLNCNPNGAYHYVKTDFIDRAEEIGLYRLHFTMEDNLTLSAEIRESYARAFRGVFYQQYILGEWVSAEGAVYPMWDDEENTYVESGEKMYRGCRRYVAIDYGTTNPCVFLDGVGRWEMLPDRERILLGVHGRKENRRRTRNTRKISAPFSPET